MKTKKKIIATINHQRIEIEGEKAFTPLASYLREEANLSGTKIVCAEGDCGACSVLLANETGPDGKLIFKSVNSCILPLYLIDGASVITVEGLKFSDFELHPVQQSIVDYQGTQCGYCTPGFACALSGMVEKYKSENKKITEKKARNYLTGNLCRCTGYLPILEAAVNIDLTTTPFLKDRYHNPDWIAEMKNIKQQSTVMQFSAKVGPESIFLPVTVEEAVEKKFADPDLRIVGGATDLGVVVNKGHMITPKVMALYHIEELRKIFHDESFITVGANATLTELEDYLENNGQKMIPEFKDLLHVFASPQIKNQATLAGNVAGGSPIGDTIPFLMACDALVVLQSKKGTREVKMSDFYLGYKKNTMTAEEIIVFIKIPRLLKQEHLRLYKVSLRKDMDIAAVTFAGIIEVENQKIKNARFALGGVGATVIRLKDIETKIKGQSLEKIEFEKIAQEIPSIIFPLSDLRASKEYRMKVAQNLFLKFYHEISSGVILGVLFGVIL